MPSNWQLHHLCSTLDTLIFSLLVQIYLWDGSILNLALRAISQVQLGNPTQVHPGRSLRFFGIACIILNSLWLFAHCIGPVHPNRKGLVLDLIGQEYAPNRFLVIALDFFVTLLQLFFVVASYDLHDRPNLDLTPEATEGDTPPRASQDSEPHETTSKSFLYPPPTKLSSFPPNPYSQDILTYPLRSTLHRLFLDSKPSSNPLSNLVNGELDATTVRRVRRRIERIRNRLNRERGTSNENIEEVDRGAEASEEERLIGTEGIV